MSGAIAQPPSYLSSSDASLCIVESRIDIAEMTTVTLQRCRKQVLSRYHKLLIFLAWKPFGQKRMFLHPGFWKFLNIFYICLVIASMLYSYGYEILFCEGQVTTYTYVEPAQIVPPSPTTNENVFLNVVFQNCQQNTNEAANQTQGMALCHEITIYAIPNTLHLIAFAIGFWQFRIKENEELDALMERVFLQAQCMCGAQEKLIRNAKLFLFVAIFWSFVIIGVSGLAMAAYGAPQLILHRIPLNEHVIVIILASVQFLGKLYCTCTYLAIIINYSTQCEFVICAIKSLCLQLNERSTTITDSMHETLRLKELISNINGPLSKMTSICVINFALKVTIGICILLTTMEDNALAWAYRGLFPVIWTPIMAFPLIQAARVTKTGEKLRQSALELRVFGYKSCDILEMDSFILFTNSAKLRTKLFSMPIKPAYLISCLTIITFTLLILFQTNVIKTTL